MKVTCQSCQARYTIADEKVRGKVAKIRCKKCGTTILVDGTDGAGSSSSDGPVSTAPMAADAAPLIAEVDMPASPEPLPAVKPVAPAPEPVALRRPGRAASTDLFGGARHEEAIATSAPATPSLPHVSEPGNEKLTGARNENSVLFSLSALTGSPNNGPPVPGPEAIPSSRTADLRSLIGTGPSAGAPSKDKSKLDDIMNLGGGGLYSPALISPALAPPPLELSVSTEDAGRSSKSKGRWLGIAAAVVLIGGGVTAFAMMKGGEQTAASAMGSAAPSATMAAQALTAAGTAEPAPATSATAAAPTESATASAAAAAQPAPEGTPTAIAPGQPPPPKPEAEREKKPMVAEHVAPKVERVEKPAAVEKPAVAAPAPAPAPAPVTQAALTGSASGEFDRAAAMSILSNTATAAQGCKKPDGPTGSGKVAVTYANNGVATTANIEGPPFAGTAVGGCIAGRFRSTRIPPFAGSPVTVHKSFFIN
jgi:predicted Zn finger-like uncharacterized protein